MDVAEKDPKKYDPEETREEMAERLIEKEIKRLAAATKHSRDKFLRHGRHLSDWQRQSVVRYLRADFERTLGVLEDTNGELPEFSFAGDWKD